MSSQPESEHLSGRSTDAESQHDDSQFIMPSLQVPQRRPFSLSGKSVGKLKILIAGPPGTGKGTIIQAISQCCEHIVHMDHVVPSSTKIMNEVYASTRPRSLWHSPISSENSTKRRHSMSEVLDRNLCFVVRSPQRRPFPSMESEMRYLDSQLRSVLEKPLDDSDLWSLLTNGGQPNVDLVLYMVPQTGLSRGDIDFIREVQGKTNIVLLLARSDEISAKDILECKDRIRHQVSDNGLDCFSFPGVESECPDTEVDVFAVSSLTEPDYDVIDASILMNSAYSPPLVPTELAPLMEKICSEEGSTWLRQSAASKCIRWRKDHLGDYSQSATHNAVTFRDPRKCALSPVLTLNPFGVRRYWHRVELSDWAEGLRRSLKSARLDEISWQPEEMEFPEQRASRGLVRRSRQASRRSRRQDSTSNMIHQDPLGVLHLAGLMRRNGRLILELISIPGILGCFAALVAGPEPTMTWSMKNLVTDVTWWLP